MPAPPLPLDRGGPVVALPRRIWIDTDAACGHARTADPDDCLAILLLARSPACRAGGHLHGLRQRPARGDRPDRPRAGGPAADGGRPGPGVSRRGAAGRSGAGGQDAPGNRDRDAGAVGAGARDRRWSAHDPEPGTADQPRADAAAPPRARRRRRPAGGRHGAPAGPPLSPDRGPRCRRDPLRPRAGVSRPEPGGGSRGRRGDPGSPHPHDAHSLRSRPRGKRWRGRSRSDGRGRRRERMGRRPSAGVAGILADGRRSGGVLSLRCRRRDVRDDAGPLLVRPRVGVGGRGRGVGLDRAPDRSIDRAAGAGWRLGVDSALLPGGRGLGAAPAHDGAPHGTSASPRRPGPVRRPDRPRSPAGPPAAWPGR